jgi:hypothetical protein
MTYTHSTLRSLWSGTVVVIALMFGATDARGQSVALPSSLTSTATMTGRLFADSVEKPVGEAEVSMPGLKLKTRSNGEGHFVLRGIPVGTHRLEVRRVGYEPYLTTMTIKQADNFEMDIVMQKTGHILDVVIVDGSPQARRLKEFNENRRFGFGTFVTREKLARYVDFPLATALVGKAPMLIGSAPPTLGAAGMRVAMSGRSGKCLLQVVVNDMTMYAGYEGEPPFDLASIQTQDVLAVEHYTMPQAPLRYKPASGSGKGAACGTLVIYTR